MNQPLVSVIIPTFNRRSTIKRAIDSVLTQTWKNFEIIIVDDCSTDDTFAFIQEQYGTLDNLIYIINEQNCGAGESRNIGVSYAHGDYIAFHDSDDEWMPQKLELQMQKICNPDSSGIAVYSIFDRNRENGTDQWPSPAVPMEYRFGNVYPFLLLTPLVGMITLLMRKDIFLELGGFNSDLHSLEDYEFTLRLAQKYPLDYIDISLATAYETENSVGKRNEAKIMTECYILAFHYENLKKHGLLYKKMAAIYEDAQSFGCASVFLEALSKISYPECQDYYHKLHKENTNNMKLSVCIITKNECAMLQKCLDHLAPYTQKYGHEIIITDTGSTDGTIEMCRKYTEQIYEFPWINDFSAARNFAASKASHDWILCIDSDEYIRIWDENELQTHMQKYPDIIGNIIQSNTCGFGKNQHISNDRASRFYNRTYYHFCRPIHEQLEPVNPETGHHYLSLNVIVDHMSYAGTPEELYAKAQRNIGMLKKELTCNPHDPYTLFQLGQSYYMIGDFQNALVYYDRGLSEDVDPNLGYVRTMVNSYGYTLLELKEYARALELEGVYQTFADRADFVFLMGLIYLNNALFDDAISQFEKATTFPHSTVDGANSYRAWHNLGVIYECMGYTDKAYEYYQKCGDFPPATERIRAITHHSSGR